MFFMERRIRPLALISLIVAFTLIAGGTGGMVGYFLAQPGIEEFAAQPSPLFPTPASPSQDPHLLIDQPSVPQTPIDYNALTIQDIFVLGDKSTVAISTTSGGSNIFGQPVSREAAGSGFILSADGYILTNQHVIEGATGVTVMLYDGTELPAEIIGSDFLTDIAVLKVNAEGLSPVRLGDSDKMAVGDQVVAIGNPLGELANSLTVGYISAKKRIVSIDSVPRLMLQTDASVSPGNSGGPLFNISGEVIGVVAAKTVSSGVEGIGFAIPINLAIDIAEELIQNGSIGGRPLLGITYQEVSAMTDGKEFPKGVYVSEVTSGSAAAKAGIKQGDVITHFNGERITEGAELLIALNACRVGQTVPATVWRNGSEVPLTVTLETEKTSEQQPQPTFPWGR